MKKFNVLTALLIMMIGNAFAQVPKYLNIDSDKLALGGFDPVAYFLDDKAVKGKASIAAESEGVRYLFASHAHKELFLKSPATYKPEYGGWCAYAMGAKGEKVEVDPETFKIANGKLYLFYNRFFNNTLDTWNKDEAKLKASADKNWSKLISQ